MDGHDVLEGTILLLFMFAVIWGGIALGRSLFIDQQPSDIKPQMPEPLKFPIAPAAMSAFPLEVVEKEFAFLLKLLADFSPSSQQGRFNERDQNVRGTVTYDNAIRPFMEHVMDAVNEHNSKIAKHNGDDAKYSNEVANYVMELERRIKRV